jgi:hypothetical protein
MTVNIRGGKVRRKRVGKVKREGLVFIYIKFNGEKNPHKLQKLEGQKATPKFTSHRPHFVQG